MKKIWMISGDTHADFSRFKNLDEPNSQQYRNIIILGDAGVDFYLNKTDGKLKTALATEYPKYTFYLVRGNHEERPTNLSDIRLIYDDEVKGDVYYLEEYPNIKYLRDGELYEIEGHKVLIIGGAYSVDKWYRLAGRPVDTKHWTGWFKDEQLTSLEMAGIMAKYKGQHIDIILSHTCPYAWEPRDLFKPFLDQSTIDKTMEHWMDDFKDNITFNLWLFGHYHDDRLVRPHVEMLYKVCEELDSIWSRWNPTINHDAIAWCRKDPNFYLEGI